MTEQELQDISRALTHMIFRNTDVVETMHANEEVLNQDNMKKVNIEINNRIYSILNILFRGTEEERERLIHTVLFCSVFSRETWDDAKKVDILI